MKRRPDSYGVGGDLRGICLMTFAFLILAASTAVAQPRACDYYASPDGQGSGRTASASFQIKDFWAVAQPGRTLCLLDGVYRGPRSMITPPPHLHGGDGGPITIRALNDGNVLIDGETTNRPVLLNRNDHFVLEGFNASRSSQSVVRIIRSRNNVVRRVAAWDAADGNTNIFSTSLSEEILFEDVAGWGIARKTFSAAQGGTRVTCRRCWGRWEGSHVVGPKMTYTLAYNNHRMTIENSIGTWSGERMRRTYTLLAYDGSPWSGNGAGGYNDHKVNQAYGIFSMDSTPDRMAYSRILGSLAYIMENDRYPSGSLFFFSNIDAVELSGNVGYVQPDTHPRVRAFALFGLKDGAAAANLTGRLLTGVSDARSALSDAWSISDFAEGAIVDHVPSPFVSGQLCHRYKDGVLTKEPLWPWPMNQRIVDAMLQSGRSAVDVTATIEQMFGTIPSGCRS